MNQPAVNDNSRAVNLVGYFATPLALVVGTLGIFLATINETDQKIAAGLLGFTAFYNVVFPKFFGGLAGDVANFNLKIRLYLNLAINSALVFLLGESFRPIWLLLALTPIASAIYGTRNSTLVKAVAVSIILLVIQAMRADRTTLAWGERIAEGAFIILISLLVNSLATMNREGRRLA